MIINAQFLRPLPTAQAPPVRPNQAKQIPFEHVALAQNPSFSTDVSDASDVSDAGSSNRLSVPKARPRTHSDSSILRVYGRGEPPRSTSPTPSDASPAPTAETVSDSPTTGEVITAWTRDFESLLNDWVSIKRTVPQDALLTHVDEWLTSKSPTQLNLARQALRNIAITVDPDHAHQGGSAQDIATACAEQVAALLGSEIRRIHDENERTLNAVLARLGNMISQKSDDTAREQSLSELSTAMSASQIMVNRLVHQNEAQADTIKGLRRRLNR